MFKFVVLSCFISVAFGGLISYYPQPTIIKQYQPNPIIVKKIIHAQPEAPANYDFNYAVNEHSTGDNKAQHESARNGVVHGSYQLDDADGFRRIVDYTADDHNGFQATVRREPLQHQTIIKKIVQPAIIKKIIVPAHNPWQQAAYQPW